MAVLCPDYVVYRGRYCTESVLTFTSSCVELKGSTSDGNEGTFSFQWGIDDIVNIDSQWSERVGPRELLISVFDTIYLVSSHGDVCCLYVRES